jgi:hypothetical protein
LTKKRSVEFRCQTQNLEACVKHEAVVKHVVQADPGSNGIFSERSVEVWSHPSSSAVGPDEPPTKQIRLSPGKTSLNLKNRGC